MKKFIAYIILFAGIFIAIDVCYGVVCDYLHENAKGGGIAKRKYVACDTNEDIILFGSSRMLHHYNPMIIEDSLGMTCFNAGEDGNGIIMSYGFMKMILERYSPKMIIYDIHKFDYNLSDNMQFINLLKPFYKDHAAVRDLIEDISPADKYKMKSSLYRYNSLFIRVLGSVVSSSSKYQKGYLPLENTMDYDVDVYAEEEVVLDEVKLKYLRRFIHDCKEKGVKLAFFVAPVYLSSTTSSHAAVKALAEEEGVPFFDYYTYEKLTTDKDLFEDQIHLNYKGADEYTRLIIPNIREVLNK